MTEKSEKGTVSTTDGVVEGFLARIASETLLRYLVEKGVVDLDEFHTWQEETLAILAKRAEGANAAVYQALADAAAESAD